VKRTTKKDETRIPEGHRASKTRQRPAAEHRLSPAGPATPQPTSPGDRATDEAPNTRARQGRGHGQSRNSDPSRSRAVRDMYGPGSNGSQRNGIPADRGRAAKHRRPESRTPTPGTPHGRPSSTKVVKAEENLLAGRADHRRIAATAVAAEAAAPTKKDTGTPALEAERSKRASTADDHDGQDEG